MNLIAKANISVCRPIIEVYDYVSNLENFGQWFPGVISITSCDSIAHEDIGKQYYEIVKIPFRGKKQILITVMESRKYKFIATEGDFSPLLPRMEIYFEESNSNLSAISWNMYSRNNRFLFRCFLLPVARLVMQKRALLGIKQLKNILEN